MTPAGAQLLDQPPPGQLPGGLTVHSGPLFCGCRCGNVEQAPEASGSGQRRGQDSVRPLPASACTCWAPGSFPGAVRLPPLPAQMRQEKGPPATALSPGASLPGPWPPGQGTALGLSSWPLGLSATSARGGGSVRSTSHPSRSPGLGCPVQALSPPRLSCFSKSRQDRGEAAGGQPWGHVGRAGAGPEGHGDAQGPDHSVRAGTGWGLGAAPPSISPTASRAAQLCHTPRGACSACFCARLSPSCRVPSAVVPHPRPQVGPWASG